MLLGKPLSDFEQLLEDFFFNFPRDPKPPLALYYPEWPHGGQNKELSICLALAGFRTEDVKVYVDQNTLYIEGDNTQRGDVPEKFQCKFKRAFPTQRGLDLSKAEVSLKDGILAVKIPVIDPEESRTYLFGEQ